MKRMFVTFVSSMMKPRRFAPAWVKLNSWFVSAPEYDSIVLTSVQKRLDLSVENAAKAVADGSFKGGIHVGTISSGEIGIAPFHNFDSKVPQGIKDELKQIQADIVSGAIKVDNFSTLP